MRFITFDMRTIGVAWFSAEDWSALLAASADRANLPETFAEFEALAEGKMAGFAARGVHLDRVVISVPALVRWCSATGRPVDANARAAFAAILLARRGMQ